MSSQEKLAAATDQADGTHNAGKMPAPHAGKMPAGRAGETPAPRCSRREWFRQIARGAAAVALVGGAAWLGRHGVVGGAGGGKTLAPCPPETLGYCAECSRRGDCALPGGVDFRARGGGAQGGES